MLTPSEPTHNSSSLLNPVSMVIVPVQTIWYRSGFVETFAGDLLLVTPAIRWTTDRVQVSIGGGWVTLPKAFMLLL